jgi:hypothetical protein
MKECVGSIDNFLQIMSHLYRNRLLEFSKMEVLSEKPQWMVKFKVASEYGLKIVKEKVTGSEWQGVLVTLAYRM